jgi:hypothetical protein
VTSRRLNLGGWTAFSVSGLLFTLSGIADRDPLIITGSIVWLVGVTLFLAAWRGDDR